MCPFSFAFKNFISIEMACDLLMEKCESNEVRYLRKFAITLFINNKMIFCLIKQLDNCSREILVKVPKRPEVFPKCFRLLLTNQNFVRITPKLDASV